MGPAESCWKLSILCQSYSVPPSPLQNLEVSRRRWLPLQRQQSWRLTAESSLGQAREAKATARNCPDRRSLQVNLTTIL